MYKVRGQKSYLFSSEDQGGVHGANRNCCESRRDSGLKAGLSDWIHVQTVTLGEKVIVIYCEEIIGKVD